MVFERSRYDFEYYQIEEEGGNLFDICRVPLRFILGMMVPKLDHRINEAISLYDPEGHLKKAKDFLEQNYRARRRIDARADIWTKDAEMYLTRASTAANRGDFESAMVYSDQSLIALAYMLMDISDTPISRRSFVWNFHRSAYKLNVVHVFSRMLGLLRLRGLSKKDIVGDLQSFEVIWKRMTVFVQENDAAVEKLHDRIRLELRYLSNPKLLDGILKQIEEMLVSNETAEASMYLRSWILSYLEAYAWLITGIKRTKYDYVTLFETIKRIEGRKETVRDALGIFHLNSINQENLQDNLEVVRELLGDLRLDKRRLIESCL
jgi:hypothetical protein